MVDEPLLDIHDVAKYFGVSTRTIRTWLIQGSIPAPIQVRRRLRWKPSEIRDFVDACKKETAQQCTN